MTFYRVNYHPTTKEVLLESGVAAPAAIGGAYTNAGTFEHTPDDNEDGYDANKVLIHFVQDKLYALGQLSLQAIQMFVDKVRTLTRTSSATPSIAVAATHQITYTWLPANTPNKEVTFVSADPTKATVSATGLVTGVAAGSSVVTTTSVADPTLSFTTTVTVTA